MNPLTVVNIIASGILTAGVSAFMILLYRSDGVVKRWPLTGNLLLRASLTATAAGSLFNCLTASTPPLSEIILNCGLAQKSSCKSGQICKLMMRSNPLWSFCG